MAPKAYIAHQTRGRLRLRIPGRRRDLPYFIGLYDELRHAVAVEEVTLNPVTGSVLLRFDPCRRNTLMGMLADRESFDLVPSKGLARLVAPPLPGTTQNPGRIERFLTRTGANATDPQTIVFLIVTVLSVRQILRGQILIPVLTLLPYAINLAMVFRKDVPSEPSDGF